MFKPRHTAATDAWPETSRRRFAARFLRIGTTPPLDSRPDHYSAIAYIAPISHNIALPRMGPLANSLADAEAWKLYDFVHIAYASHANGRSFSRRATLDRPLDIE
ncbi:hypothetical protein [Mesorhizobium carmichaelinearum]|uniref:hypothetical protein n=1 Tax=Mesorhizobium carmichaelinearum TaxID=1208188 RepID=UPI0015CE0B1E|nr:hypothetical protein [Mesorhizobium carmichaelinearum]